MATLKEVKLRIQGVRNTQKITKAMKIVASTKLRVHERSRKQALPFSQKVESLLRDIIQYSYHASHPLLSERRSVSTGGIIIIGSDRGLCGSFNSNLFRKTLEHIEEQKKCSQVMLVPLGKRTYNFFKKTDHKILFHETNVEKQDRRSFARQVSERIVKSYLEGEIEKWCIISNRFTSRVSFGFSHDVLLPITISKEAHRRESLYLFEDDVTEVLNYLLPIYVADLIYKYIIESQNAEELSRMMAMDYATENAEELIGELTLFYNRTRQNVITREISEIVGGAEALK